MKEVDAVEKIFEILLFRIFIHKIVMSGNPLKRKKLKKNVYIFFRNLKNLHKHWFDLTFGG